MPGKKRLPVPDNQLALIPMEPEPPREKKPRARRLDSLEERVTQMEGEMALISGQLEREDDDD